MLVFLPQLLLLLLLLLLELGGALRRALALMLAPCNLATLELRMHPLGQHRADSLHPIRLTQQQHRRDGTHEPAVTCQAFFHIDSHIFQALALDIRCGDHPLDVHEQLNLLELLILLRTSGHSAGQLSGVAMRVRRLLSQTRLNNAFANMLLVLLLSMPHANQPNQGLRTRS